MKTTITSLIFFITIIRVASAQEAKMIAVNDIRQQGVTKHELDTSTNGHAAGDLIINRTLTVKPEYFKEEGQKDTIDEYQVHFFKKYQGKLNNYGFGYANDASYDKAAYYWINDTIVSVTLFNSATKENKKLKLVQSGNNAGLMTESLK